MGEVLNFEKFQSKHQQYIETCKRLYDTINYLYNQLESDLEIHEKALFKKVVNLFNEVVTTSFLSLEEQKLFIEKYNNLEKEETLVAVFARIMNYIYMTYLYKGDFLKQKSVYIQAILDTISNMEIPYTSLTKIFNVFLNGEVSKLLEDEWPRDIRFILEEIICDVNFDNHPDLVFKSCLDYLNEIKNAQKQDGELINQPFERNMKSIYEYYLFQMTSFNNLIEELDIECDLSFNKEKLNKLKKITMLEFLPNNRKEEFYDTVEYLCKKMGLLEQCRNLLMMIDIELEFLKNSGIIIEGVTYENRRL